MADFRMKLISLAGLATVFTGMAFGQATFNTAVTASTVFVRAEGTTEMVAPSVVTVNNTTGAAVSVNLQVFLSPSLTITSQSSGTPAVSETTATPAGGAAVAGTVSGSSVTFSGITIPNGGATVTIANIRVNATQVASGNGIPTAISETIFASGTGNVTPNVLTPVAVAYALNGLGAVTTTNTKVSETICNGLAINGGVYFTVNIADNFASAFRTQTDEQNGSAIGANNGTRLSIVFANVPSGITNLYLPLTVFSSTGAPQATMQLISSATAKTGAGNLVADAKVKNEPTQDLLAAPFGPNNTGGVGAVAVSNGSATAYYEVNADNLTAIDNFAVNVYLNVNGGVVPAPTTATTATVSFAPIGASTVPNFVSGSSTQTVNGNNFIACSTTLLFPFVTNQLGFDTGIAISNTSTDTLASGGKNSVNAQSGTCALSFFGAGAPTSPTTSPSVATGTTWAATASALAPNFQGYMIANCNFQYAHGFAFVSYGLTTNNGAAMGYLGLVINGNRGATEALEN